MSNIGNPEGARADARDTPRGISWKRSSLILAALGVVYGDIGTSPLYAVRESVLAAGGEMPTRAAVMGSISLIFWALMIVVTGKYVNFVLRADNKGEGGSLALAALAHRSSGLPRWTKGLISACAVIGLSLFFGEALLTPAISVLSAVEGLEVEEPGLAPLVLPISLIILIGLFALQSRGTGKIGRLFGPIITLWFASLGALGAWSIFSTPEILAAVNPAYGYALFAADRWTAFLALGSVVLAVTGAEALYADLGHFGRGPIRIAWLYLVLPALLLNYFGQGAAILRDTAVTDHVFFSLAEGPLHYPMVVLATCATIIASQAVISAVFSIAQQAVQLGLLPRMEVRHTSATEYGQVFVPRANALMLAGVVLIVLIFKNSGALAAAYGLAVTGVFVISTLLLSIVALRRWRWNKWLVLLVFGTFGLVDLVFFSSTLMKLFSGGWLPVMLAGFIMLGMDTWRRGRRLLSDRMYGSGLSTELFLERADKTPVRVAGTAIYITPRLDEVPGALLHNLKHNKVLHERVLFLRVDVHDEPYVKPAKRLTVTRLGKGFHAVEVHFGFMETPNVPRALEHARGHGLAIDLEQTTFFVRRDTLVRGTVPFARWRKALFMRLYASAQEASQFYRLPPGRVVELGSQTEF